MFLGRTAFSFPGMTERRTGGERRLDAREMQGQLDALDKSQAVISFSLDGRILDANANFLATVGYAIDEIRGQHHRLFVDTAYGDSAVYRQFWEKLGRGEYDAGQYKRIARGGREIWLQASYNPIFDAHGKPVKVVKFASDITAQKQLMADLDGKIAAIGKSQAVIEFSLDGRILEANANFLAAVGYAIEEIRGQHHGMFVDPAYRQSIEYRMFWEKLGRGEFDGGEYKRFAKGGRELWLEATYNPIMDMNGKPLKVVKYATDITARKQASADFVGQLSAISKAQAVIEFSLDGRILLANENFLSVLGYTLDEVRGQHHGMFVEPTYRQSPAYRQFWEKLARGEYDAGQYKRIAKGGWGGLDPGQLQPDHGYQRQAVQGREICDRHHRAEAAIGRLRGAAVGDQQVPGGHRVLARRACPACQRQFPEDTRLHAGGDSRPASRHVRRSGLSRQRRLPHVLGQAWAWGIRGGAVQAHRQGRCRGLDPGELQPDHGHQRQAGEGRQVCDRRHRAGAQCGSPAPGDRADPVRGEPGRGRTTSASVYRWRARAATCRRCVPASTAC